MDYSFISLFIYFIFVYLSLVNFKILYHDLNLFSFITYEPNHRKPHTNCTPIVFEKKEKEKKAGEEKAGKKMLETNTLFDAFDQCALLLRLVSAHSIAHRLLRCKNQDDLCAA